MALGRVPQGFGWFGLAALAAGATAWALMRSARVPSNGQEPDALGTLDSALEGLEVGDTVDEALVGRLGEVRATLEDILERSERGVEGATQTALGEGQGDDTTAAP
jgi:hypothetical protein